MKKIHIDKIINIEKTDLFDNKFLFDFLLNLENKNEELEIIYLSDLLEKRKNYEVLEKTKEKYAMYSNVYSPEDELEIFQNLFDNAIKNNKKIHIVWITLKEEVEILEKYYEELWFLTEDINCFDINFEIPLVTVSVKIENIMWKWSDYKSMKEKIFFNPPIRESWQVKAMFKWINRGVIAWIFISNYQENLEIFLWDCIRWENILPLILAKVLKYNFDSIWLKWQKKELIVSY